jgi:hypothetical protein
VVDRRGGDVAISVGQAFRDGERWLIDATDPNIESVVAEVRLNRRSKAATWRSPAP